MANDIHRSGTAPVKLEYLLRVPFDSPVPDDDAAEGSINHLKDTLRSDARNEHHSTGPFRRKLSKEEKKERKGANKCRRFGKIRDQLELCWKIAIGKTCEFGEECRNTHDVQAYLAAKPRDIRFYPSSDLSDSEPFVHNPPGGGDDGKYPSLDMTTTCPIHAETGECRYGLKCRFMGGHTREDEKGELVLVVDEEKKARSVFTAMEVNYVGPGVLKQLRSKTYPCPISKTYLQEIQPIGDGEKPKGAAAESESVASIGLECVPKADGSPRLDPVVIENFLKRTGDTSSQVDTPDVPARFPEKKRLMWDGKTYLAPLTTVGNLPFRRLCVTYGADITCGEMGIATAFLAGSKEEWSLVRRHSSEGIFGVQLAGNKPATLVPTAEIIGRECVGNIDFVDVNCGCPIDLVFRSGSGSALLDAAGKLGKIIVGMNRALGEIPVTVKLRTGVKDGRNTAHKLMPRLGAEWNVGCITLHGRTRQQRYTKLADWAYIKQCVNAVRAREAEEDLPQIPIFGGGDCFSSQDYWSSITDSGVDGVMVGRGALIKPWIFTEIKERREWDISSRERLDLIRKYAEYGINHFGSDTAGVNTTRRYLCEALSFQHRYVPIGLLERLPGCINDRAPAFRGRDELETLLASGDSRDWVRLSEMFLGPAPESWTFTPKHKSNSYGAEEGQG